MHHHRPIQRGISTVFIAIFALSLAVSIASAYFIFSQNLSQKAKSVTSFEDCAKLYPVMESYPEQCQVPGGKHFTRELTAEEKQKRLPPTKSSPRPEVDKSANWKEYINNEYAYSFKYPMQYSDPEIVVDNTVPKFLHIWLKKSNPDLELSVISYIDNQKNSDCEQLLNSHSQKKVNIAGVTGCMVTRNDSTASYQALVKKGEYSLSITMTALDETTLEENAETFDEFLATFKFLR